MLNKRFFEIAVGFFMIIGMLALFVLAFKVSNFSQYNDKNTFQVTALFDNVGDLKIRAPITISGVRIGEVSNINIDPTTLRAKVTMFIDNKENALPEDTSAKILTAGLIGANYVGLIPGYADNMLKDGSIITETQPALILENIVSQMIYQLKDKDKKKK